MTPAATNTALAAVSQETRLPRPAGIQPGPWQVLCEVIFPHVRNPRSIMLALEYCTQRKLDILKRPVNIVPMWSSELRKEVDTIWPSINETQITAARSNEWAGLDAAKFGPTIEQTFIGTRKDKDGSFVDARVTVKFPEWCEVTVYRLKQGQRYPFTDTVRWLESYGRSGGSTLPNQTWIKRPFSQLAKVAKAASLRAAFPEESGDYSDAEMDGGVIDDGTPEHETTPRPKIAEVAPAAETVDADTGEVTSPQLPEAIPKEETETWRAWGEKFIALYRGCSDIELCDRWEQLNLANLDAMQAAEAKLFSTLQHSINKHKLTLAE